MNRELGAFFFVCAATISLAACGGDSSSTTTGTTGTSSTSSGTGGTGGTGGSGGGTTTGTGGSVDPGPCNAAGAVITNLPACASPSSAMVEVSAGCTPTVDGTLHDAEWGDGACFDVGPGDMTVQIKHDGDAVYIATSGTPTCGCPMQVYFQKADGTNFVIGVFDDPFNKDGDRSDFTLTPQSTLQMAAIDKAIVTACPGGSPSPIDYEWKIPLSKLGLSAGKEGQFKLAIVHAGKHWPEGLSLTANGVATYAADEPSWGVIHAASW